MKELRSYRDSHEELRRKFGEKGFITTREIAEYDEGKPLENGTVEYHAAMRRARTRYGIKDRGLPIEKLARIRCKL